MSRSAFGRDFRDLHGDDFEAMAEGPGRFRAEYVRSGQRGPAIEIEVQVGRPPLSPGNEAILRGTLGFLGLVWALILGVALLGLIGLGGVAVWALATS